MRLAVLVQQLVAADVAAVLFSANPLTGARGEVVINASWGLGESIVGGTVTPDTYVARKAGGALLSRVVAEKRRMTVSAPGGTREVDVPRLLQRQPTLGEAQVAEMAALACSLEQHMGYPVDVECVYAGGAPPDNPVNRAIMRFFGGPAQPAAEPGLLRGNAGSPGRVRGVAKVVRSLAEAGKLGRDDILVAETTAPPWRWSPIPAAS